MYFDINNVRCYTQEEHRVYSSYCDAHDVSLQLLGLCKVAFEEMKKHNKPHAIYAVKKYDECGVLWEVDFYNPPIPVDDEELDKRVEAWFKECPSCVICAVHEKVMPKKWEKE